ncbi:hypothetical protein NQ317_013933 [Molorchus minor]|uniref:RecA family profile 1 domain-containing protein n=1 Tax=Molorchus minor TaxID=1323400 RepID=A0ABQ9K8U1_9CUCU|nr:hypothetical protein NQ317_013933 [Molorchus minor]
MSRLSPNMHTFFNADIIELLNSKKIYTVVDFINSDARTLEKITRATFRVGNIGSTKPFNKNFFCSTQKLLRLLQVYFIKLRHYRNRDKKSIKTVIDMLLEGGLFTANIYEICGLPATGKTLFCLTLVKNVISNTKDNVYYLDTKRDFSAQQLKLMLNIDNKVRRTRGCNEQNFSKKINNRKDLITSLFEIKQSLIEGLKLRLIIIDSLPALYLQSSDHIENNSFLNNMVNILRYLTVEFNTVVVITNLITLWNEGSFKTQERYIENISCGKYWYNIPNVRLKFSKNSENKCQVTLLKTMKIPPDVRHCEVQLTKEGIKENKYG